MSVFATAAQDRLLDLGDLLRELVAQGRVGQEQAEQCLAIRRSAVRNQQHPLEFLAAQQVEDLKRPDASSIWRPSPSGWPSTPASPTCASTR